MSVDGPYVTLGERRMEELARRFGTPLVAYSIDRVRANACRVSRAYAAEEVQLAPAFAFKSCYIPQVTLALVAEGWNVDVQSRWELERVLAMGVPGSQVMLTGLGWDARLCALAVDSGVDRFVVDSRDDALALAAAARAADTTVSVLVRAGIRVLHPSGLRDEAGKLGHYGKRLTEFAAEVARTPGLELIGLHAHATDRMASTAAYDEVWSRVADAVSAVRAGGNEVREVDVGGGMECMSRLDTVGAPVELFAKVAAEWARKLQVGVVRVEYGRLLVGDAATVASTVIALKRGQVDRVVAIIDAPGNTLLPAESYRLVAPADNDDGPLVTCTFADGTCTELCLTSPAVSPEPRLGDLILLAEAGAYTTVFSELWAADLPTLVLVDDVRGELLIRDGATATRVTWDAWYEGYARHAV